MDTFTRNLLSDLVPLSMGILAVLSFNSEMYVHFTLWLVGLIIVRLILSTGTYAIMFRDSLKDEYPSVEKVTDFVGQHFLRS